MISGINSQYSNYNISRYKNSAAFRGNVAMDYPADTVEISSNNQKKKMSKGSKLALGFGSVGIIGLAAFLIAKGRSSEVKKLAEHIDFTKADSVEAAIKFGKENLGIKSYKGFEEADLDVINWVNEGLVNNSNKMRGVLRMPKQIVFDDKILGENTLAGVITDGKYRGWFGVNKKIFGNMDGTIKESLTDMEKNKLLKVFKAKDGDCHFEVASLWKTDEIKPILKKVIDYREGKVTDFRDKLQLYCELDRLCLEHNSIYYSPLHKIKQILNNPKCKEILEKNGLNTNLSEIEKMDTKEQANQLIEMLNCDRLKVTFKHSYGDIFQTIYHEMGHLQDMIPRVKSAGKFKSEAEYPKELKEWLNNDKNMQIAGRISGYSTSGPAEFIAETYADMIMGKEIPEEVMKLYKEMKGPMLPNKG